MNLLKEFTSDQENFWPETIAMNVLQEQGVTEGLGGGKIRHRATGEGIGQTGRITLNRAGFGWPGLFRFPVVSQPASGRSHDGDGRNSFH